MSSTFDRHVLAAVALLMLSACDGEQAAKAPSPLELTRDAVGHYCGMIVADHSGPKAQIFIAGHEKPVWFSSARDALAYMRLPGEAKNVRAVFVNDMGRGNSWKSPARGTWIDAREAIFVLNSSRMGGMGKKETVPFSTSAEAEKFIARFGGNPVMFDQVPSNYVLGDDTMPAHADQHDAPRGSHHGAHKKGGES